MLDFEANLSSDSKVVVVSYNLNTQRLMVKPQNLQANAAPPSFA